MNRAEHREEGKVVSEYLVGLADNEKFPRADELTLSSIDYESLTSNLSSELKPFLLYMASVDKEVTLYFGLDDRIAYDASLEIKFKQIIGQLTPAGAPYIPGTHVQTRGIGWEIIRRDLAIGLLNDKINQEITSSLHKQSSILASKIQSEKERDFVLFTGRDNYRVNHAGAC